MNSWTRSEDAWIDEALADLKRKNVKPPDGLVFMYLRRMQRRVLHLGEQPMGGKKLAPILGMSSSTVDRKLRECWTEWSEPELRQAWFNYCQTNGWKLNDPRWDANGTDAGPERDATGTKDGGTSDTTDDARDAGGTKPGPERDAGGHRRGSQRQKTEDTDTRQGDTPNPRRRSRDPSLPSWARRWRDPKPVGDRAAPSKAALASMLVAAVRDIHGGGDVEAFPPLSCEVEQLASEAKAVKALWHLQGEPDLAGFLEDVKLIAWAVREGEHDGFTWLREHGFARDVGQLCKSEKFKSRLAAAKACRGRPARNAAMGAEQAWCSMEIGLQTLEEMSRLGSSIDFDDPDYLAHLAPMESPAEVARRKEACRRSVGGSMSAFIAAWRGARHGWSSGEGTVRLDALKADWCAEYGRIHKLSVVEGGAANVAPFAGGR